MPPPKTKPTDGRAFVYLFVFRIYHGDFDLLVGVYVHLVWNQARAIDNMKKDIKKLSPITQDLRRLLEEWNEREGFPFRYNIHVIIHS